MTRLDERRPGQPLRKPVVNGGGVVKSAGRVIRILECFAEQRRPLKPMELAREVGTPASSMSVLLHSLVRLGYLSFDPAEKAFFPTLRVALLGNWLSEELSQESAINRMMQDLSQRTGETVILATEAGLHVQYIQVIQATAAIRYHLRAGTERLLPAANLGLVLLSRKTDQEIDRIVRRINVEYRGQVMRFDRRRVLQTVAEIRKRGYAYAGGMIQPGAGVIAMPLPLNLGHRPLALGVGGTVDRLSLAQRQILRDMRTVISKYVGA